MDWKLQVALGMKLIKMGCENNTDWNACSTCPFDEYCDAINADEKEFNAIADIFAKDLENLLTDKEIYVIV